MTIYSAYLAPKGRDSDYAKDFRLVSDRKAILALIIPPFWLAWHRLWLELSVYVAVWAGIAILAGWQPGIAVVYLSALPGLYLLLEGNELVRRNLERQGWCFTGIVDAENPEEAELKFVHQNMDLLQTPALKPNQVAHPISKPLAPIGLFPE